MKLANLFLSGLAVAAMGFTAIGCNENDPGTGPGDGTAPSAPSNVQATSLSANSVGLKWTASADTGTITYTVSWAPINSTTSTGSVDVAAGTTTATATNLTAGEYKFSVVAKRSGLNSTAATVNWAAATRYPNASTTTTIKMYETASSMGSGLTLDPSKGGPKNVSVGASNTTPNSVQLAIYTTSSDPANFEIGPAYAFPEYKNADKFDQNVFVSENSYVAQSLDTWYSTGMITVPANGNVRAFKFPVTETGTTGQGFYVRTGATGDYHYARVFIKKSGGKLLQNDANGRYVELEISYQPTANLAYAKAAGRTPSPVGATSRVYHP